MISRILNLNIDNNESFFLWGPRKSGKSTLLKLRFPDTYYINLLKSNELIKYRNQPALLSEVARGLPEGSRIIIDEIQKAPDLLNEVHHVIEDIGGRSFGLCGSSARKVKRGHANLLGGRAIKFELFGFSGHELNEKFDLDRALNHGLLPQHYLKDTPARYLRAYVEDYLKEEILDEGLVRNLPLFSEFLTIAALGDTQVTNFSTIARDCGVSSHTVKSYYEILADTILGTFVPAYTKTLKRRTIRSPKFYFFDTGIVNQLARRLPLRRKTPNFGLAFENWVFHEIDSYNKYCEIFAPVSYWRLETGHEVDFIIGDMDIAIECKSSDKITSDDLKGVRRLLEEHKTKRIIIVYTGTDRRITEDKIEILPHMEFLKELWAGEIF